MNSVPPRHRPPSGIAGPAGGYFHKDYAGRTKSRTCTPTNEVAAVHAIARNSESRDDFQLIVDALGLGKTVDGMRTERRSSQDDT